MSRGERGIGCALRAARVALLAGAARAAEDAGFIAGVFEPPRAAPELALRGSDGKELRLDRYRGKVVIVGFGFTSCPDVCPTTLAALAGARKKLGADAERVQVVYVTVDPERDDAERLRTYLADVRSHVHRRHGHAPSSSPRCASAMASRSASSRDRSFSHSSFTYLIDREGRIRALMPYGHSSDDYAHDVRLLLHGAERAAAPADDQVADPAGRSRDRRDVGGAGADLLADPRAAVRDSAGHLGAPDGRRRSRDPAQPDPAHARRARRARAPEPRRRAADLRPDAHDARPELPVAVRGGFPLPVRLHRPCEWTDDDPRRAVPRHAVGAPSLARAASSRADSGASLRGTTRRERGAPGASVAVRDRAAGRRVVGERRGGGERDLPDAVAGRDAARSSWSRTARSGPHRRVALARGRGIPARGRRRRAARHLDGMGRGRVQHAQPDRADAAPDLADRLDSDRDPLVRRRECLADLPDLHLVGLPADRADDRGRAHDRAALFVGRRELRASRAPRCSGAS